MAKNPASLARYSNHCGGTSHTMDLLEKYLGQVYYIHGPGVAEESYYGALDALFNAVGETLHPRVCCVMQLKDSGAGIPDGWFFTADQLPQGADVTPAARWTPAVAIWPSAPDGAIPGAAASSCRARATGRN